MFFVMLFSMSTGRLFEGINPKPSTASFVFSTKVGGYKRTKHSSAVSLVSIRARDQKRATD